MRAQTSLDETAPERLWAWPRRMGALLTGASDFSPDFSSPADDGAAVSDPFPSTPLAFRSRLATCGTGPIVTGFGTPRPDVLCAIGRPLPKLNGDAEAFPTGELLRDVVGMTGGGGRIPTPANNVAAEPLDLGLDSRAAGMTGTGPRM
jgi:hypothetical protein